MTEQARSPSGARSISPEQAGEWLAAFESGALNRPENVHDAGGWDNYWKAHLKAGVFEQGLSDMVSSDSELFELLSHRGTQSILCVGNGLSMEAVALAGAGFAVTALDISQIPRAVMVATLRHPDNPLRRIPGFAVADDDSVQVGRASEAPTAVWPRLHHSDTYVRKDGGTLSFVTGDLCDGSLCPGPYDVVVERRTVQLFPEAERIPALEKLVARLSERGLFVTHQHYGGWRPGEHRTHYADAWLRAHDFVMCFGKGRETWDAPSRLARVKFSTG